MTRGEAGLVQTKLLEATLQVSGGKKHTANLQNHPTLPCLPSYEKESNHEGK